MGRKVAFYGIFAALAVLMGYVEAMVQIPIPVPGIKLGLANVIVVIAMYFMGNKTAIGVNIIRVIMSALLFNGFSGFLYSISGAFLSFVVLLLVHYSYFFERDLASKQIVLVCFLIRFGRIYSALC